MNLRLYSCFFLICCKMSFMTCCVAGCSVTIDDGGVLHRFPNPTTEKERFQKWVQSAGNSINELDDIFIHKNRRICRRHFAAVYQYPANRLCKLAIPTLFIQGVHLESEDYLQPSQIEPSTSVLCDITNHGLSDSSTKRIVPVSEIDARKRRKLVDVTEAPKHLDNPNPISEKPRSKQLSKKDTLLKKAVLRIKAELKRTRVQKNVFKKKLSIAKKTTKTAMFSELTQNMSKTAKTFFNMQVTQAGKKTKGRRYTFNQKVLALSLLKASPKAYRLLSELCIMPKRKTLQDVLQRLNLQPGINNVMMEQLKKRVAKLPLKHRYCTIIFDEMAIAPSLNYDKKNDVIVGFVDDGVDIKKIIADHVLVFMVRGVVKKYKQPIAFSFCSGSTKSVELKRQIINVCEATEATGLHVVATVCDQGATNVAAINSLLQDTKENWDRRNEEWRGGFFQINGRKIFPLYDPPHLIKGVRNNLLTKNLYYVYEGKECVAKWEDIINLYRHAPGFMGVTIVPKLTNHHVTPSMIPKMRVKHCTQVFSTTVSVAIGVMSDVGKLRPQAKETATVLMLFDKLFDSVNGSFSNIQNGKIYRTAVTPKSRHHQLWSDSLPILKSMKFVDTNNKKTTVPSLSSWVKTIEGFQNICKEMEQVGVNSLLLRNFNQDPVENFFGAVRAHGYSNIMPTAFGFQAAYKTLLVNNMTSAHSVGSNCEKDDNKCLKSLKNLFKKQSTEEPEQHLEIAEEHLTMALTDIEALLNSDIFDNKEKCAALGYCAGWLVKTARKNVFKACATCRNNLESDEEQDFHKFIKVKEYENKRWLCYPSRGIFENFAHMEKITYAILQDAKMSKIKEYVKTIICLHIEWNFLTCETHKEKLTKYLINKSVVFCLNNWCREINQILSGKAPLWDQNDAMKVQAWNHFQKYKLRKRMRQTGVNVRL